jgi:hypothetical protein
LTGVRSNPQLADFVVLGGNPRRAIR